MRGVTSISDPPMSRGMTAGDDIRAAVAEHGYAVVSPVFDPGEMQQLACELDNSKLQRSKAGVRHAMRNPVVSAFANDPRLLGIAAGVLGDGAVPYRATLFDKSATANWLVVWHQDTALPLATKHERPGWGPWSVKEGIKYAHAPATALSLVIALRIHLDDCTSHNGGLRVLPGTQTRGVLSDDEIQSIVASTAPVNCSVPQGGVLVMRPLVIHASSKSRSDARRRVLHIECTPRMTIAPGVELAVA